MAAVRPGPARRRPRRGSLERPVNGRMYRGTWLLVGLPLLLVAFTVGRAEPLPPPALPPTFDSDAALALATELARTYPNRTPGSAGALGATEWVSDRLRAYGFEPRVVPFTARVAGHGELTFRNVVAVAEGRADDVVVVTAHRDNLGAGPGANANASGTAVLIELARTYARVRSDAPGGSLGPARTIVFVSTDGGAYGGIGAARFAEEREYAPRAAAVVNLDSLAGAGPPRLELAGDRSRSPAPSLVATATARLLDQTAQQPEMRGPLGQLLDLAFPFTLLEHGPFLGAGIPALTLTTATRPPDAFSDTAETLNARRLDETGRWAQAVLTSLDQGLELGQSTAANVYLGDRVVRGWAVQLLLIAMLLPFLAVVVDLFARARRRRIPLAPALRSFRSRLLLWTGVGGVFALLGLAGAWPEGAARPLAPDGDAAREWPAAAIAALVAGSALLWLLVRQRLLPRRPVEATEQLAGYAAALLALGTLGLVVIALNPFLLVLLLPSLHAWLWLPQVHARSPWTRLAVFALGTAGPVLLVTAFALRLDLGLDAPWYLASLVAVGYVDPALVVVFLAWLAVAGQCVALAANRYAPYPSASERPPRGPFRELVRRAVLARRARRRTTAIPEGDAAEA